MSADVVIGSFALRARGAPEVESGERFAREILEHLERELEQRDLSGDLCVVIPRIDLELSLAIEPHLPLAQQIARVLARYLAEAFVLASRGAPQEKQRSRTTSRAEAELLIAAASNIAGGDAAGTARLLERLGRIAPAAPRLHTERGAALALLTGEKTIEFLGRLARRSIAERVLALLEAREIEALLRRISADLRPVEAETETEHRPSAFWRRAIETSASRVESFALPAGARLLAAIGEAARLAPQDVVSSASLRRAITAAIAELLAQPAAAITHSTASDASPIAPPGEPAPLESATHARDSGTAKTAIFTEPNAAPAHQLAGYAAIEAGDDPLFADSTIGGLVFALVPLMIRDFDAMLLATRSEPSLAWYEVLRAFADRELDAPLDPAISWLAGLWCEPSDRDRAADRASWSAEQIASLIAPLELEAGAIEAAYAAWADRAALDLRGWLGLEPEFPLKALLRMPARLWRLNDRIEVELPFTEHYTAFLKAGLLVDWRFVRRLEHRDLALVFRERPQERS